MAFSAPPQTKRFRTSLIAAAVLATLGLVSQSALAEQRPAEAVDLTNWTAVKIYDGSSFDVLANQVLLTGDNLSPTLSIDQRFTQSDLTEIRATSGYEGFGVLYGDDSRQDVTFVSGLHVIDKNQTITANNASISVSVSGLSEANYLEVLGVNHAGGVLHFTGNQTLISATADMLRDEHGESVVYGYLLENPIGDPEYQRKAIFSADQTLISASSTHANGVDVYGVLLSADAVDAPEMEFERGNATISVNNVAQDRASYALFMHYSDKDNADTFATVSVSEGASLTINAQGDDVAGIFADNGTFVSNGTLSVNAQGIGENRATAVYVTGNANLTFTGESTLSAQSEAGDAYALYVEHTLTPPPGQQTSDDQGSYPTTKNFGVTFAQGSTATLNGAVFVDDGMAMTVNGKMTINGAVDISGNVTGTGAIAINGNGQAVSFNAASAASGEHAQFTTGSLAISNATVTNSLVMDVADSITLENVTLTNDENGDIEAEGKVVLGAGTTLINYGHFGSDDWVVQTGAKYLESLHDDVFDADGNALLTEGRFELAGGILGAIDDEDFMTGVIIRPDAGETEASVPSQFVVSAGDYSWKNVIVDRPVVNNTWALQVTGGNVTTEVLQATQGNASVTGGTLHADRLVSDGNFTMSVAEGVDFTVGQFVGSQGGDFRLSAGTMQAQGISLSGGALLTIAKGTMLTTSSAQIFTTGLGENGTEAKVGGLKDGLKDGLAIEGSLTLNDAKWNLAYSNDAFDKVGSTVTFTGTLVDNEGNERTEVGLDEIGHNPFSSTSVDLTVPADQEGGVATVNKTVGVKSLVVESGKAVSVAQNNTLTLFGTSGQSLELVTFGEDAGEKSIQLSGNLQLGGAAVENAQGTISHEVEMAENSQLVVDAGTFEINTVSGSGMIAVGNQNAAGNLTVGTLDHKGMIFIDPAWVDGQPMSEGSFLTVEQVSGDGLKADVIVGQNSTFVYGADKQAAVEAFDATKLQYGKDAIQAVMYIGAPLKVTKKGSIYLNGKLDNMPTQGYEGLPQGGGVKLAAGTLAMFNVAGLTDKTFALEAVGTVEIDKEAKISLVNAEITDTGIGVIKAGAVEGVTAENINNVIVNANALMDVTLALNGNQITYTAERLAAGADTLVGTELADLLNTWQDAGLSYEEGTESADRGTKFLSRLAYHTQFGVQTEAQAVEISNQAAALAATSGVYNAALDASELMNRSLDRRMTLTGNFDRTDGVTVWADVLGGFNQAKDLYGNGGYDMDLYGAVLGADTVAPCGAIVGAAVTVGKGDGGSKDAAIDVDNDVDFVGVSLYGSHRMGNFNSKIDIGYMHTKSDLSATAFGMDIGEEVKADAWTLGLGGEYLYKLGSIDIVPHVGLRWTRLDVDGYTGALKTESDTMDIFTVPLGVAFSGNVNVGSWSVAPMADISVVPSFGDDEATSKVRWSTATETIKTQVIDDAPVQMTLGVNAQTGNWTVGASYELDVGGDERMNNAFSIRARYAF
ncbi:MAG TPA: autotransporter domain-containing protein [Candidatus Aphodousia faecavium]|nr:autotransporter domain-containing protein [Candidatus Aphodousia faecavium]